MVERLQSDRSRRGWRTCKSASTFLPTLVPTLTVFTHRHAIAYTHAVADCANDYPIADANTVERADGAHRDCHAYDSTMSKAFERVPACVLGDPQPGTAPFLPPPNERRPQLPLGILKGISHQVGAGSGVCSNRDDDCPGVFSFGLVTLLMYNVKG
jgi:hypothetical protein